MDESQLRSRHYNSIGQTFLWALLLILLLVLNSSDAAYAQVVTNITDTQTSPLDLGTDVNTVGTITEITGGTRPGGGTNLFHSFDSFTLGTGDTAHFLNDMQLPTNNIFGRVSGEQSTIDGTLQTNNPLDPFDPMNFGEANLWLVNPSGVLLGPNARVEVGGSVSFSTANYLRFDGTSPTLFDMLSTPESLGLLDVAPVVAFGFTGPDLPAPITVQGSILQVPEGKALSLVGGDINIVADPDTGTPATLMAPSGQINLVSVTSPGEILFPGLDTGPNINGASFTTMGTVTIIEGALLDVSGQVDEFGTPIGNGNSGTVFVRGGQLVMDASVIFANTVGPVDGERTAVDIQVSQDVALTTGAVIFVATSGSGLVGDVQMSADNISLDGGAAIISDASGLGQGGNVQMSAGNISLDGGAAIISGASGLGQGGNVTLQGLPVAGSAADPPPAATTVTLSNGALIQTQTSGPGSGGTVSITADSLKLENGSFIITANSELGLVGGDISLNVGELHLLGDPLGGPFGGSKIQSSNSSTGTDLDGDGVVDVHGVGGNVTVQGLLGMGSVADKVEISGGSGIVSETQDISGDGGRISITANFLDLLGEASIIRSITSAFGTDLDGDGVVDVPGGRGGDIVLAVQDLSVAGLAAIRSDTISPDQAAADGGSVTVQGLDGQGSKASSVLLSGPNTGIFSDSASGVAGDLTVNAGTLTITNGAVISAGSSTSSGPAGKVTVTAGSVVISADGQIFSRSFAQSSGQVTITADALTLDNGSIDTSTSNATGSRGGDVVLNGGTVSLTNGASINSQSGSEEDQGRFSTGRAGDITMNVGSLTLEGHSEITSSSKGTVVNAGDAGNITIDSGTTVVLNNSSITTKASVSSGGQIEINAPEMIRLTDSEVSTSVKGVSGGSDGGNIKIDPQFVILQNSQLTAQANAGAGGAINVIAGVFLADPNSLVSASSQSGPQGTVNIQSPVQNIGGELAPMSEEFASAVALLAQQCAARVADGKFSTFVIAGREGLPVEPGGFLASPSLTAELLGSSLSGRDRHTLFPAVSGTFPEYEARPIQLAKFGGACHQ